MSTKTSKQQKLKVPTGSSYGTGKRKSAIAKVWLFPGSGKVEVNGQGLKDYLNSEVLEVNALKPLAVLNLLSKYDCRISCVGGGIVGQAGAIRLGISRALVDMNEEFRQKLKENGFMSRDPRVKERKKYGRKKARKGFQYRKR